uniref:Leucine zipper protein 2 n=1 Tax=Sphenodon punctatus TaxID=8508 RepID=A0A8D0L9X3_SPHPU
MIINVTEAHYGPPDDFFFCVRQGYEELERQLKEVFKERSNILHQLSKTSKELEGIKVNLQSLKNDEASAKTDVQKLLELGQKQREEMKSLQEAFQKQLNEAVEKAEKQQATINFLKTEMERKSKMIRDLQNENKSLKNKLLSGNKLCGIHAEEVSRVLLVLIPKNCKLISALRRECGIDYEKSKRKRSSHTEGPQAAVLSGTLLTDSEEEKGVKRNHSSTQKSRNSLQMGDFHLNFPSVS